MMSIFWVTYSSFRSYCCVNIACCRIGLRFIFFGAIIMYLHVSSRWHSESKTSSAHWLKSEEGFFCNIVTFFIFRNAWFLQLLPPSIIVAFSHSQTLKTHACRICWSRQCLNLKSYLHPFALLKFLPHGDVSQHKFQCSWIYVCSTF